MEVRPGYCARCAKWDVNARLVYIVNWIGTIIAPVYCPICVPVRLADGYKALCDMT